MIVWLDRLAWFWLVAACAILLGYWTDWIPYWQAGAYSTLVLVGSLLGFGSQAIDKWRANGKHWRIPEKWLHLCELLGGWPGAHFGQQFFRHKTAKAGYRQIFFVMITLHIVIVIGCLYFFQSQPQTGAP